MPPFLHHPVNPSADSLIRRELPTIEGSQGGFVAVIVALSLIIVLACVAVFFLLRNHEPTEQERAARRQRSRRYREEPDSSQGVPLKEKFGNFFWNKKSGGGRSHKNRWSTGGWVQAGSGDEWEPESDHEEDTEFGPYPGHRFANKHGEHGPELNHKIVEFPYQSPPSKSGLDPYIARSYADPFANAKEIHFSPTHSDLDHSPSSGYVSPPMHTSDLTSSTSHQTDASDEVRRVQCLSRSLETGTKFIESL